MGTIYARGSWLWLGFKDLSGKWVYRSSGYAVGQETKAKRALALIEEQVRRNEHVVEAPMTVSTWLDKWAVAREERNWTAKQDVLKLKRHVLPVIGRERLVDVKPKRIRELVAGLRSTEKNLAPRTIRNIYWALSRLFADAVAEELVDANPCMLQKGDLPRIRDKDRAWRQTAVYSRGEAEQLFSDPRVPADRHVLWGLGFLAGLRLGEVSALRWRDYDSVLEPLGRLSVGASYTRVNGEEKGTKTENPRLVPVHPTLAGILSRWKLTGWAEYFGRPPRDGDLVLPNRAGRHLTDNNVSGGRELDFGVLEMRPRRFHDARRTFISLAQADGARPHVLKLITHGEQSEVMDLYTTLPWLTLCETVSCLKMQLRAGELVSLQNPLRENRRGLQPMNDSTAFRVAQEGIRSLPAEPNTDESEVASPSSEGLSQPTRADSESGGSTRRNVGSPPDLPDRLRRLVAAYSGGRR